MIPKIEVITNPVYTIRYKDKLYNPIITHNLKEVIKIYFKLLFRGPKNILTLRDPIGCYNVHKYKICTLFNLRFFKEDGTREVIE